MKDNEKILAHRWFDRAKDDELSSRDILKNRQGAPSTVCFLSQQLAEKYLKGFLVFNRKKFPKIHQLDRLLKLCEEIESKFVNLREEAGFLSGFYVTTRYPAHYPEGFNWDDAEKAMESALKIKEFVLSKLGDSWL